MPRLFELGYVYPSDSTGEYTDLKGEVVAVRQPFPDSVCVTVRTKHGTFDGWTDRVMPLPEVGYRATIRMYRAGGGWYPDNIIKSWSSHAEDEQTRRSVNGRGDGGASGEEADRSSVSGLQEPGIPRGALRRWFAKLQMRFRHLRQSFQRYGPVRDREDLRRKTRRTSGHG